MHEGADAGSLNYGVLLKNTVVPNLNGDHDVSTVCMIRMKITNIKTRIDGFVSLEPS